MGLQLAEDWESREESDMEQCDFSDHCLLAYQCRLRTEDQLQGNRQTCLRGELGRKNKRLVSAPDDEASERRQTKFATISVFLSEWTSLGDERKVYTEHAINAARRELTRRGSQDRTPPSLT